MGQSEPLPELYPLKITVTRLDMPVTEGGMIFLPDPPNGSGFTINTESSNDGTFSARTEEMAAGGTLVFHPGIPAGTYRAIYHPHSDGAKVGLEVEFVERVTIEPGENTLSLTLPDEMPTGNE